MRSHKRRPLVFRRAAKRHEITDSCCERAGGAEQLNHYTIEVTAKVMWQKRPFTPAFPLFHPSISAGLINRWTLLMCFHDTVERMNPFIFTEASVH